MNLVELGIMLREKREEKGLEIKDVADILKISINVLIALEDANRERLPELAFRVAFVKSYCKFLEFDDALIEEAMKCLTFVGEEPNYANKNRIENEYITNTLPENKNFKILLRIIIAVAVILFAYIAATAFMESNFVRGLIEEAENSPYLNENPVTESVQAPVQTTNQPEVQTQTSQSQVEEEVVLLNGMTQEAANKLDELVQENMAAAIESSKNKKNQPAAPKVQKKAENTIEADQRIGAGSQYLLIKAKAACWMQITLDGKLVRGNFTLEQGKSVLLEYDKKAIIFLGNPSGVEIVHNGEKQKPYEDTGKTMSVAF